MPSGTEEKPEEELRSELVVAATEAIGKVRDIVVQLNEAEKRYLENSSIEYRQLVNTIANWKNS